MAQGDVGLDRETFSCSICLELLKDPVTAACGHSYCLSCIRDHWDREDEKGIHSCPQCRRSFISRPELLKNTMLAALVEQLKKTGDQAAPADHCYAGAEDVACDVCTERKLKALKSCLVCLASYCHTHLQPHYDAAPLKKHQLGEPLKNLQKNICSEHYKVMEMFCRSDQQCICHICSVEQHRGHDIVSAAAERREKEKKLQENQQIIQQRIQDREEEAKELQRIRFQKEAEVRRVKGLEDKLEQEMAELRSKAAELLQLSHTEDHCRFLFSYPSASSLAAPTHTSSLRIRPRSYSEYVTAGVSESGQKIWKLLRDTWTYISLIYEKVLLPEPKTRAEFLRHSCDVTLDPNTAHTLLVLSVRNRRATVTWNHQPYSDHPDRFRGYCQVLSRDSLTGRCYWEVEVREGGVGVAVAYKNISRLGGESRFGLNNESWALQCKNPSYRFGSNGEWCDVSGPWSSTVGVYLDRPAGLLSFYSVSDSMTLLHRVQTSFTQPLHAGLRVYWAGSSAEMVKLG